MTHNKSMQISQGKNRGSFVVITWTAVRAATIAGDPKP